MTEAERLRGERLRAFYEEAAGRPFVWGQDDCSLWPLEWVSRETGQEIDVPVYSSREEAEAIVEAAGGLVAVWARLAPQLGLVEVAPGEVPPLGSVGVIAMTPPNQPTGCIFAHAQVACFRVDAPEGSKRDGVTMWGLRTKTILRAWALPDA